MWTIHPNKPREVALMRGMFIAALLLLAACAQQPVQPNTEIASQREISPDRWNIWQLQEIYEANGERKLHDFELKLAAIQGDEEGSYLVIGCVEAEPEIAIMIIHTSATDNLTANNRMAVTVRGDERPKSAMFDTMDGSVTALIDTRIATGRNLLKPFFISKRPIAVQVGKHPPVRFKPGDGTLKSMFTQCSDAKPSRGA
ncbi:MAG: hypothetical protein ACTSX7_18815 [Alphaproteobacteria bacterium]